MNNWNKYIVNGFFGWKNIRWGIKELIFTFSNKPSIFSHKRIQEFILFVGGFTCLYTYTIKRIRENAPFDEILALTGAMFVYAGYQLYNTQREKKTLNISKDDISPTP
jgi:hypothetical protein